MSSHRYSKYIPVIFLFLDLVSLNLGFIVANSIKFDELVKGDQYQLLQGVLNLLWILIFFSGRLQQANRESGVVDHLNRLTTALVINLAVVFALWFAFKPFHYSRQHLFYTYVVFLVFSVGWRLVWHIAIHQYRSRGYNLRNIVVVGMSETSKKLVDYFKLNPGFGYRLLGYFDDSQGGADVIGRITKLEEYALENNVDIIYAYLPALGNNRLKRLIDFAENNLIKVKIISQFSSLSYRNLSIQNHGNIPVVNISAIPLDDRVNLILKRAFDIIFSSIVIVAILSWMIPLVGLLIRLESKGSIFFKQDRTGLNNRKFRILKFRTMFLHDDKAVKQATKNDARITKIGAILRKTSIDEFPQFINVFVGNMSVVGPRPHAIKHNEEFKKKIDRFVQRHAVKPGITGLAQAKGFRGETSTFDDINGRVRLDRFYVKNWSILLDLKIILLTILSLIRGSERAY